MGRRFSLKNASAIGHLAQGNAVTPLTQTIASEQAFAPNVNFAEKLIYNQSFFTTDIFQCDDLLRRRESHQNMARILLSILLMLAHHYGTAQCDANVVPSDNETIKYKYRNDKCEGLMKVDVAAPRISLVNFTWGKVSYQMNNNAVVWVKAPPSEYSVVKIQGVAIPLIVPYRMDAELHGKDSLQWRIRDVLLRIGLASNNVGIYGWVGTPTEKIYIPLNVDRSSRTIRITLRASTDVHNLQWKYAKLVGNDSETFSPLRSIGDAFANRPIDITLDDSFKGLYYLKIVARASGSNAPLGATYKILIP